MLPTAIRTAINVKTAIENAPLRLTPIGTCVTMVEEYKVRLESDDEAESRYESSYDDEWSNARYEVNNVRYSSMLPLNAHCGVVGSLLTAPRKL